MQTYMTLCRHAAVEEFYVVEVGGLGRVVREPGSIGRRPAVLHPASADCSRVCRRTRKLFNDDAPGVAGPEHRLR